MANQILTTTANYDDAVISGLNNGETITINAGNLTIDSDVMYGQQAAAIGIITISATLGGSVLLDGTKVWEIPFDAATGLVPALGTLGTNTVTGTTSGTTGELIRVWAAGSYTPTAAGAGMPSTGFIKLRTTTGTFLDNETITLPGGATVTVNSITGGNRSWIHVNALETGLATIPRLGAFTATGDWYYLGITNGTNNQEFKYPIPDHCPAIQIETGAGTGVYEWWLNAGARWAHATQMVAQDSRGKFFGCTSTGIITVANTTTGAACGMLPATGARVRIPNILLTNSASTNYNIYTHSTATTTRYEFSTTGGADISFDKVCGSWHFNFTSAYRVVLKDMAAHVVFISNSATSVLIDNIAIGLNSTTVFTPCTISGCYSGVTVRKVTAARFTSGSQQMVFAISDSTDIVIEENTTCYMFGSTATTITRGHTNSYAVSLTRCSTVLIKDIITVGAKIGVTTSVNVVVDGHKYADIAVGATTTNTPTYCVDASGGSDSLIYSGLEFFSDANNTQPYSGIITVTNATNIVVENIASSATPLLSGIGSGAQLGSIIFATVSKNITIRRVYLDATRTDPINSVNTVQTMVLENVWANGTVVSTVASSDVITKGCKWTNVVSGQTAVYGSIWQELFTSDTTGRIVIQFNEPLAYQSNQYQIISGTPKFTSTGRLSFGAVGDSVEYTCPWKIIGHTGFENTHVLTGANPNFIVVEYSLNTGTGYGAWKDQSLLSTETVSPTGFFIKFRFTRVTAGAASELITWRVNTITTLSDSRRQYPDGYVNVIGSNPTDIIELRLSADSSVLDERIGDGRLDYVSGSGTAYVVRRTSTDIALMRTQATPFLMVPGDAGTIPVYSGAEIQVANAGALAAEVWASPTRTLTSASGITVEDIREELAPELSLIKLIPATV